MDKASRCAERVPDLAVGSNRKVACNLPLKDGRCPRHQPDVETPRVAITALWLRRSPDDYAEVLVEIDGKWRLAISEQADGLFSHIAEARGHYLWPPDPLDERDEPGQVYDCGRGRTP